MHIKTLLAISLPLFADLAKGSSDDYRAICPSRDGQTEQRDGIQVLYRCNRRLPEESLINTLSAGTPDACIEHCRSNAQCVGSQWLYATEECRLFSVGDDAVQYQRASLAIIVTRDETGGPNPGDDDSTCGALNECRTALDDCEGNETRLQEELDECRASQGSCEEEARLAEELETCENSRIDLQSQLRACEARDDNLMTVVSVCPGQDGKQLRQGKGTFKFNCNNYKRTGAVLRTTGHGFEMCLQTCAKDSQCTATNYWPNKPAAQRCEMFKEPRPGFTSATDPCVAALLVVRH